MSNSVHVAIAILYQNNQFLLQLRDNIPNIVHPGHWGLFGGHLEPGENPDIALQRELLEEIGYIPLNLLKFGCYPDAQAVRHVYHAPLTVELNQLVLHEGWDMDLATIEQIKQGSRHSQKAEGVYPLVPTVQKILLDFQKSKLSEN
ncbi:NUDIX hydrolase [Aliterella atlantica]|uniref:NUDIX hydrolase n=1 Tax=Aliterella atlantica CENA595 TaxID=1618023 RepID=A0A0D8ZY08_9CYAN|nr:NUDIX hydrolase [Aliterella atlantica]KJH72101.1 NUDIX hydrolase [Aliterella atlantica CENA595]